MQESTKEWLGIKSADFLIYGAFLLLIPIYYSKSHVIDAACLLLGIALCLASSWLGMKPNSRLGKLNNAIKFIAYPACTTAFLYFGYLYYGT